ncbi:ZmpA/ZmpB/ZmpC family metallo-endopeptidase [Mesomycoplasma hyorhinis]|uniref:ZmpA/ZmpB/ZmpC family metallo-endopeptidase n=1 Tax=Mesomycoplasma hyorhinis TaxID=2100 RepID=UPI00280B031D
MKKLQESNDESKVNKIWFKLKNHSNYKAWIPVLLTLPEQTIYIISTINSLSVGVYESYINLKNHSKIKELEEKIQQTATAQRSWSDFWSRIISNESKMKLFRTTLIVDGFNLVDQKQKNRWLNPREDYDIASYYNFFGPLIDYYSNSQGHRGEVQAYYGETQDIVHFQNARILTDFGWATYSHELTHACDRTILFENHQRRLDLEPELFARGLFESTYEANQDFFGINTIKDYSNIKDKEIIGTKYNRQTKWNIKLTNTTPYQFKSEQDLQNYFKNLFDLVYLLEATQAKALIQLTQNKPERAVDFLAKITTDSSGQNNIQKLNKEEIKRLNLNSINDFVDNDLIIFTPTNTLKYGIQRKDWYYQIPMFKAFWATAENKTGSPGDYSFRRIAFELLAAFGYQKGMPPYVSNMMLEPGKNRLTYDEVFQKIFKLNNVDYKYKTFKDFKKAMYKEVLAKQDKLKKINDFNYEYTKFQGSSKIETPSFYFKNVDKIVEEILKEIFIIHIL